MRTNSTIAGNQSSGVRLGPHIVLVDDDPIFVRLLEKAADREKVQLTTFTSPEEAYRILPTMKFDVGLFDYDLGRVTGIQLCHFLQGFGQKNPVIIVSQIGEIAEKKWPMCVKKATAKSEGALSILAMAKELYQGRERKDG